MRKGKTLPTILGLIILVIGTFFGAYFLNQQQVFKLGASADTMPKNLRMSNITDNSITVSWTTDRDSLGFVLWGDIESRITTVEKESDVKSLAHSVTVTSLTPQKRYFFKINSDGTEYDNEGIPWEVVTGASLGINRNSNLISGSVITATSEPARNALVYANISGYLLSTLTSNAGNFVFQLGNARASDLNSYAQIDEAQTLIEVFVQAPPAGISSAQVFPQAARPVPPVIIGQTHDFRNLPPSTIGGTPGVELNLPQGGNAQSRFSVPQDGAPVSSENVTLESIEQGESITTTTPEFFGTGPDGVELTITVESENPVTENVTVGTNGAWKWTPPTDLAAGLHRITIRWIDASGITRSLTRNFVVQAAEGPAFEASGSATLETSTPTPTTRPVSTSSPTPSVSSSPTSTPLPDDVPETGSLTPTLIFTILGMGIMFLSFVIWKFADAQSK